MKMRAVILAASAFAVATFAHAEVRFGIMNEAYPPFFTKDASGQWIGFEVDLMHAVCREMKESCSFVETSWDGLIPALESGKFDAIWSGMSITEPRKQKVDFSIPYYKTPSKIIGAKGTAAGNTPGDLSGKAVGVQVSTIQANYLKAHYTGVDDQTYSTLDEALQDLAIGRIDYVFANAVALNDFLNSEQGKECCEDKGNVEDDPVILGQGVGAGVTKDNGKLRDKLNEAISAVRTSGEYRKISEKYFNFDPYPSQ